MTLHILLKGSMPARRTHEGLHSIAQAVVPGSEGTFGTRHGMQTLGVHSSTAPSVPLLCVIIATGAHGKK
eukprot:2484645-Amphidinium_carterae.1